MDPLVSAPDPDPDPDPDPAGDLNSTPIPDPAPTADLGATPSPAPDPGPTTDLNLTSTPTPAPDLGPISPPSPSPAPDSGPTTDLNLTSTPTPAPDLGPISPPSPSPATAPDLGPISRSSLFPATAPDLGPTLSADPAPDSDSSPDSSPDPGLIAAPDAGPTAVPVSARDGGLTASDEGPTVDPIKEHASSQKIACAVAPPQPPRDLPVSDPGSAVEPAPVSTSAPAPAPDPIPAPDPGPTPELPCPHSDSELVHKLAQLLLPGLATAAVDSTTGDPFRSPATVAVDLRRDLVDHLTAQSLTFIPHSLALLDTDPTLAADLDDPLDVLSHLVEDFAASRRNLLGRVSGWLLSDSREDKIDDFVQEMELNNFWKINHREIVADEFLKNIDYKNKYHCSMRFNTEEELDNHKKDCSFRPVGCKNDGCKVKYCRVNEEQHDVVCPYKVLECEQKCGEMIMRREMDRHCITVCRMKMINCPFYPVGCQSAFPQCQLKKHCEEFVRTHVTCLMVVKNEERLREEELKARAENMEKSPFRKELASALDVRRLTLAIKSVEAKMKKHQEQGL